MSYICFIFTPKSTDNRKLSDSFKMERQKEIDFGKRCEYTNIDKSHKNKERFLQATKNEIGKLSTKFCVKCF